MNGTFKIAFRAMFVAAMTLLTGSTATAQVHVKGNVFGGGNLAEVGGSVTVNMTAGTVDNDVYGGGALANTNTNITTDATIKTTVNLLGGTISGDAYGGGLGRQANNSATPAVTAVEAKVFGDVKIYLNGMDKSFYDAADATMKTVFDTRITKPEGATYYLVKTTETKGAVVKRVFGANNKNGSPQRNVTVHVFGTQHKDAENILNKLKNANADLEQGSQTDDQYKTVLKGVLTDMITKAGILHIAVTNSERTGYQDIYDNTFSTADDLKKAINDINDEINAKILDENTSADDIDALFARIYDVEAVYGGGNEAAYIPTTAYHPDNAPSGSKTQVIIEGCDETSIEAVYGGGNAASVPETNVDIVSAHEIQTVFGGGNGKDDTSYGANPGADVGVYKKGTTETEYGTGNATTRLIGGYFHEAYGASNSKGNIKGNISINTVPDDVCNLKYDKLVGAGKNADVDKDVIMILGCNPRTKNPLIFGGADNANVNGNVELTITSGTFGKVFGGNNLGGIIKGHIKVNIEETECTPIRIDELYLGGNQAAYSIYGYYQDASDNNKVKPRTAAMHAIAEGETGYVAPLPNPAEDATHTFPYAQPVLNVISCTYIGKVFGGGYGERAVLYGNPTVNINMIAGLWASELGAADKLGEVVDVFGGGNAAKVEGNTTVNIGTEAKVKLTSIVDNSSTTDVDESLPTVKGANITGNVYGGGNLADVTGNTNVNICAKYNTTSEKWDGVTPGTAGVSIAGNVYGGGKGEARESGDRAFYCEEAMVGINDTNSETNNDDPDYANFGTHVRIGNGSVNGSVYGGGEIGRVEFHTEVVIGLGTGTGGTTKSPVINGNVFGAGKGTNTHGYSGLVRGDSKVTVQGDAKIGQSVYGGGEMATVGKYDVVDGLPKTPKFGGKCTVTIQGYAEVGPNNMQMVTESGKPDDSGHVFGAGKGILPYEGVTGTPWSMQPSGKVTYDNTYVPGTDGLNYEAAYLKFIRSLGLASNTDVIIDGNAFVKGSVYGGSENGYVQANTHVTIAGGQVGNGDGVNKPYTTEEWAYDGSDEGHSLKECAHWPFKSPYKPYDIYDYQTGTTKPNPASDGHTFYGNVFGGGRGYYPYDEGPELSQDQINLGYSKGLWLRAAGSVGGNTVVDITGGHILTSVYGGNEQTDVTGSCTINMVGGTVGVPRTVEQAKAHPVTCYVFGAGKGDQRINFNTWTNVASTQVNISGNARIYGSTFGGGEDGHVLGNVETNIGGTVKIDLNGDGDTSDESEAFTAQNGLIIGTTGTSGVDGNIFGGGRGFSETALTAGVVGGNVDVNIYNGTILGTVFGGGRLASVGTFFADATDKDKYGKMQGDLTDLNHGVIRINISGGTIGATASDGKLATSDYTIGDVFGGSKGSTRNDLQFGLAKHTFITMTGGKVKGSVYGGGEVAVVEGDAAITISGGEVGDGVTAKGGAKIGNVFGGGKGNTTVADAGLIKGNTKVTVNPGSNGEPKIYHNIYGGGAYGSVGTFTYDENNVITGYTSGGKAEIYVTGGTIGTDGKENGMIFGSSRGDVGASNSIHDKLAWVYDTHVAIGDTTSTTITTATPLIKGSVYGGGENGHNYHNAYVRINGGTIGINNNEIITYKDDPNDADKVTYTGKDYNYPYRGNVYGGGCGTDKYYSTGTESHDGNGDTYNPKAGIVQGNAIVHVTAGHIVHNVYGAGAMGSVGTMTKDNEDHLDISSGGKTTIEISGGTIGVAGTAGDGNVFGAARGDETTKQTDVALVKTTDVTVSGNSTVWGNVYGGGQIGCVGTFTERADDGKYIWTSDAQNLNGLTKVSITGGETKGHVFGAGKGSAVTFKCEKAMVKKTQVSVSNGKVGKNVYGGGEIGRVEEDTDVKIGVGDGTCNPTILGSVYGAGAGLETHGYSALVRHNTTVTVDGDAKIGQSVYGGGEIASVGRYGLDEHKMPEILLDGGYCYVKVQGSATIGSNTVQGNVFGACKGVVPHFDKTNADRTKRSRRMTVYTNATDFPEEAKIDATTGNASSTSTNTTWEYYDESVTPKLVWEYFQEEDGYNKYLETLALATHPEVTIDGGATVNGSVYGGGEMGLTKGSVMVNILGGSITEDVYGGGALANTNTTSAVGVLDNAGIPQKSDGKYQTTTVYPKTTVNLLGGSMRDAYGGGLGQLAVAAQGTEGQAGYQAAVPAIEAKVFGDVKVNLNGLQAATDINTSILNSLTTGSKLDAVGSGYIVKSSTKGAVVNRVFGCNNLNGTPTKKVQVYVFGTQKSDKAQLNLKAEKNTNTYDVQAVYGGGNLAKYEPVDALLEYNETNKATVDAARPEVYIDGCDLTSIKQVYGGGNAAPVPATFVEIRRAYEIEEVFGGGNGFDNYSLNEGNTTVWYENPGANVGYYTYASYPKGAGQGTGTMEDPYKAVETPAYAGGADHKEARLAAKDIQYGSGIARLEVKGGTIHTSYGGSNSKGNVRAKLSSAYSAMFDDCEMQVAQSYGGGKNAYSDAETDMVADCAKGVKEMFGGAKDADMDGDINMLITNGSSLERVFGGNNTSGAVNGSITITLQEGGCEPIKIGELYAGGFLAPYSVYGYKKTNGVYDTEEVEYIDTDGTTKTRTQRIPLESGTRLYNDPRINVISATSIGNIFGGGYQAKLVGNPHINVNMTTGFVKVTKTLKEGTTDQYIYKDVAGNEYAADKVTEVSSDTGDPAYIATTGIGTIGNVYGGGNLADIVGDTYVEIGTGKWVKLDADGNEVEETLTRNAANIKGNVFGGGKGKDDTFQCEKGMVGVNGDGIDHPDGGTYITIGNGTVGTLDGNGKLVEGTGNVYGGGEIGRVEKNTMVTIGLAAADVPEGLTSSPVIEGSVFGGGKGKETHGYAALVRGNPTVIIQGNAKVGHNVYGGGEIASVARYDLSGGVPVALAQVKPGQHSGYCTVIVKDNAEIGPDGMKMYHSDITDGSDKPDDWGHVFGAGKGFLPDNYSYDDNENRPKRMMAYDSEKYNASNREYWEYSDTEHQNVWEYFPNRDKYIEFIQTQALATHTDVTIEGNAFVKGSVYGGSENGLVQYDTDVKITGNCQIGEGEGATGRYTDSDWASESLAGCAHWDFDESSGAPYDPYAKYLNPADGKYYYDAGFTEYAEGGSNIAKDGHTYYGNVFGGGSGSVPYFDTTEGRSVYLNSAGTVKGNTKVTISGGHILTSVYGGCESTNVLGTSTVTMTAGAIGVPRTVEQIQAHPVICNLFGAGKGDQRVFFNKDTNVENAVVNVSGTAKIYGSVFGGGEDGHVLRNSKVTIGDGAVIGAFGYSGYDGNVFGGGRGFGGDALTAGNVSGDVEVNINGGSVLGSVYGGGRLASVGYGLYKTTEAGYGEMKDDGIDDAGNSVNGFTRGHVKVNITDGTIGNDTESTLTHTKGGNVFGGSMGRLTLLNGTTNPIWPKLARVKAAEVNIKGGTVKANVYGGGELGTVHTTSKVTVNKGTVNGSVFGGGYGSNDNVTKTEMDGVTYSAVQIAGRVDGTTTVEMNDGQVMKNLYGGGEMASVGVFTASDDMRTFTWGDPYNGTGVCNVTVAGGKIGTTAGSSSAGHVFGAGKGLEDTFWCEKGIVYSTNVNINKGTVNGNVYGGGEVGRVETDAIVKVEGTADIKGNVFGAGAGKETHGYSALVRGNTTVTVQGSAAVGKSVYGGGEIASVGKYGLDNKNMPSILMGGGYCYVTVQGNATVGADVFGAGEGVKSHFNNTDEDLSKRSRRMTLKSDWVSREGADRFDWDYLTESNYPTYLETLALATHPEVTIDGSASIGQSVYGGGELGLTKGSVIVNIKGGTITEDVYGGGSLANTNTTSTVGHTDADGNVTTETVHPTTTVNLLGGTVTRNVYGGGLGQKEVKTGETVTTPGIEAIVYGDVNVNLNGTTTITTDDATGNKTYTPSPNDPTKKGCVVKGNIFGANNVNGTPLGHVLVYVHGTQNETTSALNAKVDGLYDVTGVFGGGNASDYVPDEADTKQSTEVIIEGCDLTSIKEVYGGGYGAAVPATDVLIKGTKIINNVFGGGYGAGTDNPGANVGYVTGGSRSPYALGTGKAVVQLMAGTVNNVYGGSNTKGDIRSGSNVTNVANDNSPGCCDKLSVQEIYGGGSQADMFGGTEIVLGCMPDDWIGAIYAGAENANVGNDVSLTLTSGKFGRVFGGNKSGGTIDGYIEVNIEENPECSTPIIIGGLYGGGNEAPYAVPARYFTNNPNYQSPRVNVRAFTSIGNIYGGGFGASATVTGNPLVNINVVEGGREYAGEDKPLEDGTMVTLHARSKDAKMGVIGNVFGGGNAAKVIGNTNVMIGTEAEQEMESLKTTDATTGTVTVVKKPVLGADIQGNVYGAGNNAEVTGHTNVVIGKKAK